MSSSRARKRLALALAIGAGPFVACASAVPAATPGDGWISAPDAAPMVKPSEAPSVDAGPRCPYGALEDPHRGFVRCLLPDERDAGWLPPPSQGEAPPEAPSDAGPAPVASVAPPAGALPAVEVGAPKFENGEVTKVERSLGKAGGDLARCVAPGPPRGARRRSRLGRAARRAPRNGGAERPPHRGWPEHHLADPGARRECAGLQGRDPLRRSTSRRDRDPPKAPHGGARVDLDRDIAITRDDLLADHGA